jgi:[ribosomal protein S5]-alanine N-acetyltransferase
MQGDMEILTKRFLLRDFEDSDESAFVAYQADPRMLEFYGDEAVKPGHARQLVEAFRTWAQERPRRNYQLAIVRRDEPRRLVGCCGLRGVDSAARTAELGIELAPREWGRYGYAIEVMRALAKFGFEELGLNELYGSTVSANARIARLASSLGAVATRLDTPAWMTARGWSRVEWRVTREQWERYEASQT